MDGWEDGWVEVKTVLRVAFSNQKSQFFSTPNPEMAVYLIPQHFPWINRSNHICFKQFINKISFEIRGTEA